MKTIKINDATYSVPGMWDEITHPQLLSLVKILQKKDLSSVEVQLKFFLTVVKGTVRKKIKIGLYEVRTKQGRHLLSPSELTAIISAFDYLFEERDGHIELSPRLTVNHYPTVRAGLRLLHGPNNALDNITYDDFVWLQTWQSFFASRRDAPDQLINTLYSTSAGKHKLKHIGRLSESMKIITLWFYQGTLRHLEDCFPRVFSSGSESGSGNVFDNQQRVIDVLADGDVTKKMQVRQSFLYDALYSMEMAAVKIEEIEKNRNK